jgi:ribosomal protein S18 acetylase RimI-like enzyme
MPPLPPAVDREYGGGPDLAALITFASRAIAQRFPLNAVWHPGDVVWELQRDLVGANADIRLWEAAGGVVAVAWMVGPGQVWIEALPAHEALLPAMIGWAEQAAGNGSLSVRAMESDAVRVAVLEGLGYRKAGAEGVHFRRDLAEPIPEPELPEGFRIIDCVEVDAEARAACHRDAWNHLDHLGIAATSTFSADIYRHLATSAVYDPTLDLLIQTSDGLLACNTVVWDDPASGFGTFEPVGTHHDFRGLRLARAITLEGCRRLRERGRRYARVGTAHFNAPAAAVYASSFELIDRSFWWSKALA